MPAVRSRGRLARTGLGATAVVAALALSACGGSDSGSTAAPSSSAASSAAAPSTSPASSTTGSTSASATGSTGAGGSAEALEKLLISKTGSVALTTLPSAQVKSAASTISEQMSQMKAEPANCVNATNPLGAAGDAPLAIASGAAADGNAITVALIGKAIDVAAMKATYGSCAKVTVTVAGLTMNVASTMLPDPAAPGADGTMAVNAVTTGGQADVNQTSMMAAVKGTTVIVATIGTKADPAVQPVLAAALAEQVAKVAAG